MGAVPASGAARGGAPSGRAARVQAPFERAAEFVHGRIRSGALPVGLPLPSTRRLAAELGLAPATVGRAYARLAASGVVAVLPGESRWTVVRIDPIGA